MTLEQAIAGVRAPDQAVMAGSSRRWDRIAKPLHSLGLLEQMVTKVAGLTGDPSYTIDKRALAVFCADNGVVAQGVTQTGQEVTAAVAVNITKGESCVCRMARLARCDVIPVDIGMAGDVDAPGLLRRKVARGTRDLSVEPAMSREQAVAAIEAGIQLAQELGGQGYRLLATGEMGIGNTTTSSAVAAALLGRPVDEVTGRGAGLSSAGLRKKIEVIERALALHRPDPRDPIDVLRKVGGFDIAGMAGLCLGAAACGLPVVLDGFISTVSALIAARLCPGAKAAMLASHVSAEPAGRMVLDALELPPLITAGLCLGEGTGAMAALPLLDMAYDIYHAMSTFDDVKLEQYQPLV